MFDEGRKTGEPGENASEYGKNQQQTQPIYATWSDLHVEHIGGRRHPCFLPESERGDCDLKRLL